MRRSVAHVIRIPFKHGCGDAMREKAHREFKEQAKKQSTGTKSTPLRPGQRAALKDKLHTKVIHHSILHSFFFLAHGVVDSRPKDNQS